jgi:hypothetical protein
MPTGIHHPSASPRVAHARVPGMARGGSSTSAMLAAQEAAAAPLLAPQLWPAAQQPPQPKPAVALQHSAKATMDTIKSSINATELQQALQQLWDGESSTAAGSMKLNHVHLSAALTHLAQLEDKRRKGGSSSHGYAAAQQLGRQLLDQATQHHMLALMGPRQVSNMMWASGRLGIAQGQEPGTTQQQVTASQCREASQPWLALVQAMQQHMKAVQTAPFATFSNTSRAGGGGQTSRGDHKKGRGAQPHCNIVDIVQAVHSCATAGLHPGGGWMKDALAASRPQLGRLGAQEAAILAWALAVLQQIQPRHANTGALAEAHGPLPTGDWLPAFMHAALPLLPSMSGQELALLVWALPQLLASRGAAPSGVQPALQQHLQQGQEHHEPAEGAEDRAPVTPLPAQLPDWEQQVYAAALSAAATSHLSVHDKALLLRGVGGLGWRPGQSWVDQVLGDKPWPQQASQQQQQQQQAHTQVQGVHPSKRSSRLTKASQQPHARSLANLVSSVLDLGCRPSQPWLSQALGAALQSPGGCDAADVAGLLRACVLTGHSPAAHQVEGLLSAARPHLRNAPLPQVSDIVWASARLRYMPNPAWTQAMVAATGTRFPSAPGAHTAPGKTVPLPPSRPQRAPQAAARHHQLSLTVSDKPVSYAPIHSFAQQQHQHQQVVFSSSGPAPLPPSLSASEVDALVKLLWAAAELQRHCTHASESSSSSSSMSPSSTSSVSSTANGAASCNSAASHSTLASAARVDPSRTPHTLSPARPPDARASVIPPLSPPTQLQQPRRPLLESGSVTTPLMRPAPVLSTALQQPSDRSPSPTPPPPAGRAASQEEVVTQSPQQRVDSSSSSRQGALLWVPASWVSQAVGTLSHASEAGRPQKMLKPIHIVQLVWALKTLNVVPSSAARTWLAAAVAAHAHALSPSQLVTVMAYMPRFALRRQHDRCGLLRVLIKALVKALPQMSPLQVGGRVGPGVADAYLEVTQAPGACGRCKAAIAMHFIKCASLVLLRCAGQSGTVWIGRHGVCSEPVSSRPAG